MNELKFTYAPYTLRLKSPFQTSKKTIKDRKGFIFRLEETMGSTGIGDACPFPEFGSEKIEDIEKVLSDFKLNLKLDKQNIEQSIFECLRGYENYPAFRHGLEQAILNLFCNKMKVSLSGLLNLDLRQKIELNGTIGFMTPLKSVETAQNLAENGFKTIKIKVGREDFEEDYNVIKSVRQKIGDGVKIRIDANGNWNLNKAIANLKKIDDLDIEYAEQPVNELDDYIELKNHCSTSLAPDESIRFLNDAKQFIDSNSVSYIVLKPMLLGGLLPTLEIIKYSEEKNVTPVITTSFESAIGRTNVVTAAASVKSDVAHGLGITDYFTNDLANDTFQIKSGSIII